MDYASEKIKQIAFHQIKGIGPRVVRLIMHEFSTVSEIYDLNDSDLKAFISKKSIRDSILNKEYFDKAEREWKFCEKNDVEVLFVRDKKFPARLSFHEGSPTLLFYRGNADLNSRKIVAMVGTRAPSTHGKLRCEKVVEELKSHNCLVVSGLAYGVDIACHKAALKHGLDTIGVMGSGHDKIYPEQHASIARSMVNQGGLLTEFLSGTEILREMFPMRNRVVAAMSDAVIVMESARKGGSLITAEFANEYGKDVFAVPGRPEDESSQGCNLLIKSHKAHMYESIKDLEYIMRWSKEEKIIQAKLFQDLTDDELSIVNVIRHRGETHIDMVYSELNKPNGSLAALILNLELKGIIKSLPGKRYICV